jgi:antibiotic biosynthesis monooxygenase (ABM) superfamily enzyme
LEKSNKELQENMRIQNLAAAEAMASLDLVAKRVQKRQEMRDMLARFKNLEAELAVAKSPEILKALQLQEAALTEEMNRAAKEYEALDSEFNESKKPDTSPAGK